MGGGCCAVNHIQGAPDGICYRCHSQLQEQAASPPSRTSPPPRRQTTSRMPHWTEIVNHLAVRPHPTRDTDEGDSDDAEWLTAVHGNPDDPEADRGIASAHASTSCVICRKGINRWADHRVAGRTCSTCASNRGLGPFATPQPSRPYQRQTQGRATGSAAGIPWTSWRGLLTSPAADDVGREIGGRYSIVEQERRTDFNDGQAYTWKEFLDYYLSQGWYVYQVKDHWKAMKPARSHYLV